MAYGRRGETIRAIQRHIRFQWITPKREAGQAIDLRMAGTIPTALVPADDDKPVLPLESGRLRFVNPPLPDSHRSGCYDASDNGLFQFQPFGFGLIGIRKLPFSPERLKTAGDQRQTRPDGHLRHDGGLFFDQFHRLIDLLDQIVIQINACFHVPTLHPTRELGNPLVAGSIRGYSVKMLKRYNEVRAGGAIHYSPSTLVKDSLPRLLRRMKLSIHHPE